MPINYKLYNPDWKETSKRIRFDRAKNKCEKCGAQNYEPHPKTGKKVILTVAHLDQSRTNDSEDNLAALCQRCHFAFDHPYNLAKKKFGRDFQGDHQLKINLKLRIKEFITWLKN